MLMFTFAISCSTPSNLPWFTDLTFQVPVQYCSLQHQTLLSLPYTVTTEHWFHFDPAFSFFLENCPLLFSSNILDTFQPGSHNFLPFHTICRVLEARILEWFAISFSSGPSFVRTLHYDLSILGDPHGMAHAFTEVTQAPLPQQSCDPWSRQLAEPVWNRKWGKITFA